MFLPIVGEILGNISNSFYPDVRLVGSYWTYPKWRKPYFQFQVYNNRLSFVDANIQELIFAWPFLDPNLGPTFWATHLWSREKSWKCDIYEFLFGWNNLLWRRFSNYLASTVHRKIKKWYCSSIEANIVWFIILWSSRDLPLSRTCSKWLVYINYADFQQFYDRLGFQIMIWSNTAL